MPDVIAGTPHGPWCLCLGCLLGPDGVQAMKDAVRDMTGDPDGIVGPVTAAVATAMDAGSSARNGVRGAGDTSPSIGRDARMQAEGAMARTTASAAEAQEVEILTQLAKEYGLSVEQVRAMIQVPGAPDGVIAPQRMLRGAVLSQPPEERDEEEGHPLLDGPAEYDCAVGTCEELTEDQRTYCESHTERWQELSGLLDLARVKDDAKRWAAMEAFNAGKGIEAALAAAGKQTVAQESRAATALETQAKTDAAAKAYTKPAAQKEVKQPELPIAQQTVAKAAPSSVEPTQREKKMAVQAAPVLATLKAGLSFEAISNGGTWHAAKRESNTPMCNRNKNPLAAPVARGPVQVTTCGFCRTWLENLEIVEPDGYAPPPAFVSVGEMPAAAEGNGTRKATTANDLSRAALPNPRGQVASKNKPASGTPKGETSPDRGTTSIETLLGNVKLVMASTEQSLVMARTAIAGLEERIAKRRAEEAREAVVVEPVQNPLHDALLALAGGDAVKLAALQLILGAPIKTTVVPPTPSVTAAVKAAQQPAPVGAAGRVIPGTNIDVADLKGKAQNKSEFHSLLNAAVNAQLRREGVAPKSDNWSARYDNLWQQGRAMYSVLAAK
jgi:hypothetical protein